MYTITDMQETHLPQVFEIEKSALVTPWSYDALKKELAENKLAVYLVALCRGAQEPFEVAGYAGMWHIINEGHITNIAVKDTHRRKGVGVKIIHTLTQRAISLGISALTLEVRVSNTAARRMYEKCGFRAEGYRKAYYEDTKEDAVIMWKYL